MGYCVLRFYGCMRATMAYFIRRSRDDWELSEAEHTFCFRVAVDIFAAPGLAPGLKWNQSDIFASYGLAYAKPIPASLWAGLPKPDGTTNFSRP